MITENTVVKVTRTTKSRVSELDFSNIPFGRVFSDHMLTMTYADGQWGQPEIVPFESIKMHPASSVIHYGQSIFEGLKAYRTDNGQVAIFRPIENGRRFRESCIRMCMPEIEEELFVYLVSQLVKVDKVWIPGGGDTSLYIRPFMFATDEYIGVKPSDTYKFMIFTCPVGQYYNEPLRIKIEEHYTRAAKGGVGRAKTAGNYAAALYPAKLAQMQGYHQLLWTDAVSHEYIEESGTMNIVFVIDGKVISPSEDSDTILRGITKRSVLQLAETWGYPVEERKISVAEVISALEEGLLQDAFGAGTAATIAPIDIIHFRGKDYKLPEISTREFSNRVYTHLNDIKAGRVEDSFGWVELV
jgi:branched-chain amino acid aminotransferase